MSPIDLRHVCMDFVLVNILKDTCEKLVNIILSLIPLCTQDSEIENAMVASAISNSLTTSTELGGDTEHASTPYIDDLAG